MKPFFRITASIVLSSALVAAMAGILISLDRFDDLESDFWFSHFIYATLGIWSTSLICFLYVKIDKKNPWMLGFHLRKKDIYFSITAVMVSLLAALLFIRILDKLAVVEAHFQLGRIFTWEFYKLLSIASFGLFFAALKEEVLARGYFLANLTRLSILHAVFLSAFLFMILHFIMGAFDLFQAASWFRGGVVYACIYLKSGSLLVSTIVHAAHNLVNDLVLHGSAGALVLLNLKVTTSDKLIYEIALAAFLLLLVHLFYGKNGILAPAENLKRLWYGDREVPEIKTPKAN